MLVYLLFSWEIEYHLDLVHGNDIHNVTLFRDDYLPRIYELQYTIENSSYPCFVCLL